MSQIVRVKPQKHYNWHQTKSLVTLTLPFPNTTLEKLSIQSYTTFLIVSNKQSKSNPHFFDLEHPISKISTKYSNGVLEIVMVKQQEGDWSDLVLHLPIAELRKRREEAIKNKEQVGRGVIKKKEELDVEFDRKGIQELMRLQQEEREKLKQKKRVEKEEAEEIVFKGIDEKGNIQKEEGRKGKEQNWNEKERIALQLLEKQEQQERKQQYLQIQQRKKKNNAIFTNEQIQKSQVQTLKLQEQFQQIPIRKAQDIKLTLTSKPYPHVAVRQTHFEDAPLPKDSKNAIKGDQSQKLQERNPLWLKDKGDKLAANKDYISAINAYNESLKYDKDLLPAQMNRSYCNMKLFNFDETLADCELVLVKLRTMFEGEQDEGRKGEIEEKIVKFRCRLAVCLGWKGKIKESLEEFEGIIKEHNLTDKLKKEIDDSVGLLNSRVTSNEIKQKGDEAFKLKDYQAAGKYYTESSAIGEDHNEYSIANNALVQLKLNNYQSCIQQCDKAQKLILSLTSNLNSNLQQSRSQAIPLLTKIYLRKGTALKELKQYPQSLSTLRSIKPIDTNQSISTNLIKQIEQTINKQKYTNLKTEADNLVRSNNLPEALVKYKQCLSILTSVDLVEYLSVLLNQCVCYIKMENYNEIVAVCIRGLKLVGSTMGLDYGLGKEEREKVMEFKVRFLVRKAKAYLSLKQFYNAEGDVKEALKVEIKNQRIRSELEELRKELVKK